MLTMNNSPANKPSDATESSGWAAWLVIGLAIAAVVMLAVVSTVTSPSSHNVSDGTANDGAATGQDVSVDVTVDGMAFVPASVDVPKGARLKVKFTNTGDQVHDLKIGKAETGRVSQGDTVELDAGVITESVEGYCTIAGHKMQGMTFNVNVTDEAAAGDAAAGGQAGHDHAMAGGANPHVTVPSAAERTADPGDGFTAFDPRLGSAPAGKVHEYHWTITEEMREVAPGVQQKRWLFNGQAPGPTLRGKVGDTFKITLRNEGSMGHSIDFHAGEVNPDENMATIDPGQEKTYTFTAKRSGIWMYHCSTAPMSLHIANGMAGAVIIDPSEGSTDALSDAAAEYALVADEVFLGDKDTGADADRVAAGQFDLTAFNYYPNQYDLEPIRAKVGDKIRIWVLNAGPDEQLSFHVVGEIFDTVWSEGRFLVRDDPVTGSQAMSLAPAQGGYVELTFDEPGTYSFVNHAMTHAEKGQHGKIVVTR